MTALGLDTSVAIPLLVRTHRAHAAGLRPTDAAWLIGERFVDPLLPGSEVGERLPEVLSRLGIAGGAVCDALIVLAAVERGALKHLAQGMTSEDMPRGSTSRDAKSCLAPQLGP